MCHIAGPCLESFAERFFGDGDYDLGAIDWPGTADEGVAFCERGYRAWRDGLASLDDEALWHPLGPRAGPYADDPYIGLALHVQDELIHHGAEVALLRDLYRAREDT